MHFATFSHIHILSPAFSNIQHDRIIKQLTSYLLSSLTTSNKRWKRAGSGELPSLIVQEEKNPKFGPNICSRFVLLTFLQFFTILANHILMVYSEFHEIP